MAGPKHPCHYEESFKRQIVQLYENGKPAREIKDEYDISHSTLHRWVQGIRNSGSRKPPTTAPLSRTSRSSCASATDSWRWRWTFQNRRRRYSHESSSDTGQRLPLSDIGAVQNTGRSPLHLLLDDRTSRSRAGGPDRRRRARGPARRP